MESAQAINTQTVSGSKPKSNFPIIAIGVVGLCGVFMLTVVATKMVVDKINRNADAEYYAMYNQYANRSVPATDDTSSSEPSGKIQITGYKSEDLVEIDGEWYIVSNLVENYEGDGDGVPIIVDPENTVFFDGVEYMHIENPESLVGTDSGNNVPYYGTEYVVVDIDGNMVYLVEKGDTLSDVSGRVGYSVQELAEFNSIKNVNLIYAGQTLRVPAPQEAIDYVKTHGNDKPDTNKSTDVKEDDTKVDETIDTSKEESTTVNKVDDKSSKDVKDESVSDDVKEETTTTTTTSPVEEKSSNSSSSAGTIGIGVGK